MCVRERGREGGKGRERERERTQAQVHVYVYSTVMPFLSKKAYPSKNLPTIFYLIQWCMTDNNL